LLLLSFYNVSTYTYFQEVQHLKIDLIPFEISSHRPIYYIMLSKNFFKGNDKS